MYRSISALTMASGIGECVSANSLARCLLQPLACSPLSTTSRTARQAV
jgi:hypothetical protein